MEKTTDNNFIPTVAVSPGETIRENMEYLGMTQKELALRIQITEKHLSNILNGTSPITYDTALKLETVIGPRAEFWMKLEANYQLNKSRLEEEETLKEDLIVLKNIPYKDMAAHGWVSPERDRTKRVKNCRTFFGVSSLHSIKESHAVAFRTHTSSNPISDYGILAWLRKAETEGIRQSVSPFNKSALRKLIPEFRALTLLAPQQFYPLLENRCKEVGIALVLVDYIPKTYICGATIWKDHKAIVALSARGKRADIFWFTFFHEVAHLLNHSRKEVHIHFESTEEESQADEIASNYLISKKDYDHFILQYDYTNQESIKEYAEKIGIAPFVLVGRLQHDRYIDFSKFHDLIPSYEIIHAEE
ncbi:HigA family addiction module antitoxin [Proteiniclasticum sp. C24MP]|uniref:HigA family addiction module antitoxin n=1 Tax=Proteiniclasticum sp. C24MP TaxID=3374101 RepID=UPI0037550CAE